ncbi:MAG: YaiI/YqxD family protein [Proteobacteria bacterium]|nr:YaiI/YqxD family protein [Pseudomonadota bacterium]
MQILVDADACPKVIKEIIFRVAKRRQIMTTLFANHAIGIPLSPFIKFVQTLSGFDVVDYKILDMIQPGDLVITADVPLAAGVIEKLGHALNPRGTFYSTENIQQKLHSRNLSEERRDQGQFTRGPSPLQQHHHQDFANALDRFLTKHQ